MPLADLTTSIPREYLNGSGVGVYPALLLDLSLDMDGAKPSLTLICKTNTIYCLTCRG